MSTLVSDLRLINDLLYIVNKSIDKLYKSLPKTTSYYNISRFGIVNEQSELLEVTLIPLQGTYTIELKTSKTLYPSSHVEWKSQSRLYKNDLSSFSTLTETQQTLVLEKLQDLHSFKAVLRGYATADYRHVAYNTIEQIPVTQY